MGLAAAAVIVVLWTLLLVRGLFFITFSWGDPLVWIHMLLQGYLYTGLFITAHDAMHGTVSRNRRLNNAVGQVALWLFAAFSYRRMFPKHMAHHRVPGTAEDPDFSVRHQRFFPWFFTFFLRYITPLQILVMALLFNIGLHLLNIPLANLMIFWIAPAFFGTFQLFYFGTYLPQRLPHTPDMAPHNSRTQRRNHLWAMMSCYFFGYHAEHHACPRTPWWRLRFIKDKGAGLKHGPDRFSLPRLPFRRCRPRQ